MKGGHAYDEDYLSTSGYDEVSQEQGTFRRMHRPWSICCEVGTFDDDTETTQIHGEIKLKKSLNELYPYGFPGNEENSGEDKDYSKNNYKGDEEGQCYGEPTTQEFEADNSSNFELGMTPSSRLREDLVEQEEESTRGDLSYSNESKISDEGVRGQEIPLSSDGPCRSMGSC